MHFKPRASGARSRFPGFAHRQGVSDRSWGVLGHHEASCENRLPDDEEARPAHHPGGRLRGRIGRRALAARAARGRAAIPGRRSGLVRLLLQQGRPQVLRAASPQHGGRARRDARANPLRHRGAAADVHPERAHRSTVHAGLRDCRVRGLHRRAGAHAPGRSLRRARHQRHQSHRHRLLPRRSAAAHRRPADRRSSRRRAKPSAPRPWPWSAHGTSSAAPRPTTW